MRVRNGIHLEHDVSLSRKILDGIVEHQMVDILVLTSLINLERSVSLIVAGTNAQNRPKENIDCRNRAYNFRAVRKPPNLGERSIQCSD